MTTSIVANRIYSRARYADQDFDALAPGLVLLRGLKPPQETTSGLALAPSVADHPVRACVAFEVVKLPADAAQDNPLDIVPGDVVMCRNALVDPLYGNDLAVTDLRMGVVAVLERAKRDTKEA